MNTFNKEIFIFDLKIGKSFTFQYHNEHVFNEMLNRFRKWENDGLLIIVDVRNSEYSI